MNHSIMKGFGFGLTSGCITTLGLIIGLNSTTGSTLIIISGILVIALADSMSDAMGMHIAEESTKNHSHKEVWTATIATFLSKFIFSLTFVIPFLIFSNNTAILICITWGLLLISVFSYYIAREEKMNAFKSVFEHLSIAILVIVATHLIGNWISTLGK